MLLMAVRIRITPTVIEGFFEDLQLTQINLENSP